jgi:Ca-activated chloride channel family protein
MLSGSPVTFAAPVYLWLLAAPGMLMILWIWRAARRLADARRYARDRVLPEGGRITMAGDLAFWFWVLGAASLCVVALARPQAVVSVVRRGSADIVVLQDGSASMYARDVAPDRWQRSIRFLRAFADALSWKGDRIALALFAHSAAPQLRLTKDPNALFFFLDHLGTHSPFRLEEDPTWDTNIEEGVHWGLNLVEKDEQLFGRTRNPKAFVVVSDGQAWTGNVANALAAARAKGVVVHVVGVGTAAGGLIPEATAEDRPGAGGATRFSAIRAVLDRDSLRAIARAGGGEYFEIGTEPDREIASTIIGKIRSRLGVSQQEETRNELYWECLFAAAVLLCLGTVAVRTRAELWWQGATALAIVLGLARILR